MRGESIERAVLKVRGGGRDLSVFRQGIGDQGAEILSRALRTSGAVEWVDLTGNGEAPHAPPHLRTNWTRRVPHPVIIGHAASLTPRAS